METHSQHIIESSELLKRETEKMKQYGKREPIYIFQPMLELITQILF